MTTATNAGRRSARPLRPSRHRRSARAQVPAPHTTGARRRRTPTDSDRRDKVYLALVGWTAALAALCTNWPTLVLAQVARGAAGDSTEWVRMAQASELGAFAILLAVMVARRRNLAHKMEIAASCWVGAAGMAAIALAPSRATLLGGLLLSIWMWQSTSTLRAVVSVRYDDPFAAQGRVQIWTYPLLTAAQVAFVGVTWATHTWRIAVGALAAVLACQGAVLALAKLELPHPRTERQPGRHMSVSELLGYWPIVCAIAAVGLGYLAVQAFFTQAQERFLDLGWTSTSASWLLTGIGAARMATLPVVPWMRRLALGHHPTAQVYSAVIIVASAALIAPTLLLHGRWLPILLIAAPVVLLGGMNAQNPVVRGYVGSKSADASTLLALTVAAFTYAGGQIGATVSWTGVVSVWVAAAVVILALALWVERHRYRGKNYAPATPPVDRYVIRARPTRADRVQLELEADGVPVLPAPPPLGPGTVLGLESPIGDQRRAPVGGAPQPPDQVGGVEQYWKVLARLRMTGITNRRRLDRRGGHSRSTVAPTAPSLILDAPGWGCFSYDPAAHCWRLDPSRAKAVARVVADGQGGRRRRCPLVLTDGRRCGYVKIPAGCGWRIVQVPVTLGGLFATATIPVQQISGGPLPRWEMSASQLDGVRLEYVLELGPLPAGSWFFSSPHL